MTHSYVTWSVHTWRDRRASPQHVCSPTHLYVTWLFQTRHDTFTRGITHWYVTRPICDTTHVYQKAMSHIWMSHVSYMNESCLIYEWLMRTKKSCLIYEWVMSHIWMSHVSYMNDSCLIYEWVVSHIFLYKKASSQIPNHHRVATISRLLKIVGLFCRI